MSKVTIGYYPNAEGLIVCDQLANNWVGPVAGHNEYPRAEDHAYAMRFRLVMKAGDKD